MPIPDRVDAPQRIAELESYGILDTAPEEGFDDIVALAAQICEAPVALVSLVTNNRQWFKARVGFPLHETELNSSVCAYALVEPDLLVISDLSADSRTVGNPLVTAEPHIRFYAGAPLRTPSGHVLGSLCVIDRVPRPNGLTKPQSDALRRLARQVITAFELRRSARERRDQDILHQQILDSANDYGIIALDLAGNVTSWNVGAERLLGWLSTEMIGQPASVFFTPEDKMAGLAEKEMRDARENGRGIDERWHLRKSGARFWASGEMMPLKGAQDAHVGYLKILRDRTEQHQTSLALQTAESSLQRAQEAGGVGVFSLDLQSNRVQGTPEYFRLYGLPWSDDYTAATISARIIGEDRKRWTSRDEDAIKSEGHAEYRIRRADNGEERRLSRTGKFDRDERGELLRFVGVIRDVTEEKRVEQALRESDARSRLAQKAGRIGTFDARLANAYAAVSEEFCRLFGLPISPTVSAATIEKLILPDDRTTASNPTTRADGSAEADVEYRIKRADDGRIRWIARSAEFFRDDTGQLSRMVGTVQDITERKNLQRKQVALIDLGDRLKDARSTKDAVEIAAGILGRTLTASRAGYALINTGTGLFSVEQDWTAPGVHSLAGQHALGGFQATKNFLGGGRTIAVANVEHAEWLRADIESYHKFAIRAQIVAPLFEQGRLVGAVYVHDENARSWRQEEVEFVQAVADRTYAVLAKMWAEEMQNILNQELAHRLKNTLAMVQAIAVQTLRSVSERDAVQAFNDRLQALSTAHDILLQESWAAAHVTLIVEKTIAALGQIGRILASGPDLTLGPKAALSLALLLNELTTNAIKYGALSSPVGVVNIVWRIESGVAPELHLSWKEEGGPPITPPKSRGFGSRLIGFGLAGVSGSAMLQYPQAGLEAEFRASLAVLQQA